MPVSRREFDDGHLSLSIPILQYLGVRSEEAFTADEVFEALIEIYGRRATPGDVIVTLEDLAGSGQVESKRVDGVWL